jgi:hypothetical protein
MKEAESPGEGEGTEQSCHKDGVISGLHTSLASTHLWPPHISGLSPHKSAIPSPCCMEKMGANIC